MAAETGAKKCVVCKRDVETHSKTSFCRLHMEAYGRILDNYDNWRNAYGDLTPERFLEKLEKNDYTGKWVKEVAHIILSRRDLLRLFLNDLSYRGRKD
ncbi:MAG: hypothetical protein QW304_02055 [Thermoproteota archaeon]